MNLTKEQLDLFLSNYDFVELYGRKLEHFRQEPADECDAIDIGDHQDHNPDERVYTFSAHREESFRAVFYQSDLMDGDYDPETGVLEAVDIVGVSRELEFYRSTILRGIPGEGAEWLK